MTNVLTRCDESTGTGLERTRYFPGQLVGSQDFIQDQLYYREKLKRHNRLIHGWGVVCGARVKQGSDDCEIVIEPGYVLGPFGDEIVLDREVTVNVCQEDPDGNAVSPCGSDVDPWCSDIRVNRTAGQILYVAVRYAECLNRPVRVQHSNGCGCNDSECEYSRVRDSFAVKVLTRLPSNYEDPLKPPSGESLGRCEVVNDVVVGRSCPPCPTEPWVILADVRIGSGGTIDQLDCFEHRRYVLSFGDFFYTCKTRRGAIGTIDETRLRDQMVAQGYTDAAALVQAKRAGGDTIYIPAYFAVERGETVASLLEREGNRSYIDDFTGEEYYLTDLYTMAGVDPTTVVDNVAGAVALLEGVRLNSKALRNSKLELDTLLDKTGLDSLKENYLGAPAAVTKLSALTIDGVSSRSSLGQKVSNMTIGDIAGMEREAFIAEAVSGVSARQRTSVSNQAGEVWDKANAATALSTRWR